MAHRHLPRYGVGLQEASQSPYPTVSPSNTTQAISSKRTRHILTQTRRNTHAVCSTHPPLHCSTLSSKHLTIHHQLRLIDRHALPVLKLGCISLVTHTHVPSIVSQTATYISSLSPDSSIYASCAARCMMTTKGMHFGCRTSYAQR